MPRDNLRKLLAGFKHFHSKYFDGENALYKSLSQGQSPKTLVIGCSDSRADPAILTEAEPGDLFVVRNIGNLVPPFENQGGLHGVSSALEFAVVNLKVENIVVLGHRQCGAIRALMVGTTNPDPSFIAKWVNIAKEAKNRVLRKFPDATVDEQCAHCELEAIAESIKNLRTFPFVQQAVKERDINLVGAYFDLEAGRLLELNEATGEFHPLVGV